MVNKMVNKIKSKADATIQFRDPRGHVFLVVDKKLIKGDKMLTTKQTTKKVVAKKTTKTATPKTATAKPKAECGGVVSKPEYKNPMILENLYVKEGKSAGAIARQYGVSRGVVLHHMRNAGIEPTRTRKTRKEGSKTNYKNATWLRKAIEAGKSVY
jgi:hypothetical protein